MQVANLRRFLPERGVSSSFHQKYHLERLYKLAHEMNLEVITRNVDFKRLQNFRSQSPDV